MLLRTRSRTRAILQLHPNEEITHALHSIQPLLAQHQLQWHDYGRSPDCQFTSFIHASKKTIPALEEIMEVRRACRNWLFVNPPSSGESESEWQNSLNGTRKQGDEHSMRGLAGAFATRINLIIVRSSEHFLRKYNPPANIPHSEEIWKIYLDFAHTRHYLSTTKILNGVPSIPLPNTRSANGN